MNEETQEYKPEEYNSEEEAPMPPMPPMPPRAEGGLSAEEVEPFPRMKSQREQENEQLEQIEKENELLERQHYQSQGYHLREVKIRSDENFTVPEQFDKVLEYLGNVSYSEFTSHMRSCKTYKKPSNNYNRFDCTGLVLSLLADESEFEIINGRETIPPIKTMEQVLRCKFIPMQRQGDYMFKESLKDFVTHDGVYIGGIITQPYYGTISHMMLLIVAKDDEDIFISVFDPQRTKLENARLYNVNHDSRFVLLDHMFQRSKKVFCTFFDSKDTHEIDLRSVLEKIKSLSRTFSHTPKKDPRNDSVLMPRTLSQTYRHRRTPNVNRNNLHKPRPVSRNHHRSGLNNRNRSRNKNRPRSRSRNRSGGSRIERDSRYVKYKY